ncbi:MAG: hypothetical protein PWQ76_857 [Clostridiales bacterium]|nr:hypothetical protein [Oscillospiraceae bacterium]MDD2418795.1 hypothetical protein [Oscillospiraceae bacterium]MDN5378602.1 hypothetical protein [Clostridiales bacterium]
MMGVHGTLVLNVGKLFETMKTGLGHGEMKSSVVDLSITNQILILPTSVEVGSYLRID